MCATKGRIRASDSCGNTVTGAWPSIGLRVLARTGIQSGRSVTNAESAMKELRERRAERVAFVGPHPHRLLIPAKVVLAIADAPATELIVDALESEREAEHRERNEALRREQSQFDDIARALALRHV